MKLNAICLALLLLAGCTQETIDPMQQSGSATFGDDLDFLDQHTDLVILSDETGEAQVAVSPTMQGRVLTSTASGRGGTSFGWINRTVIASGERQEHINVFGGEDRFWLGPEGGQYSIYFAPGDPFDLDHWYVPAGIDWEPFTVTGQSADRVSFVKSMQLKNYSGTTFDLRVDRDVRLISGQEVEDHLGVVPGTGVRLVAFESVNTVTNTGSEAWTKEHGLLSVWILGMYIPSPATTVVIPYIASSDEAQIVNAAYFGEVPPDRLVIDDQVIYFRGDGEYRSKIGLSKARSKPTFGSYDGINQVLTLVQYTLPDGEAEYVNSMWELQDEPYSGDVINSYNDGPPAPGVPPLGPFYELETSSPAMALEPGASHTHVHRTIHLQGPKEALDQISVAILGKQISDIEAVFGQ